MRWKEVVASWAGLMRRRSVSNRSIAARREAWSGCSAGSSSLIDCQSISAS